MTNSAYCRECGTAISPNAADCPDCGAPQASGAATGNVALFVAILAAALGWYAFAILLGPVAAVGGFVAYQRKDNWLRYLAAFVCGVGVLWSIIGARSVYLYLQAGGTAI